MVSGPFLSGYRYRIYLLAAFMFVLVVLSLGLSIWFAWYSKSTTSWIVSNEFKTRKHERKLFELLLSMDVDRKSYFLLRKPEHRQRFLEHGEELRGQILELASLRLANPEQELLQKLSGEVEAFLASDPLKRKAASLNDEVFPKSALQRVRDLLQLNQAQIDTRIAKMNELEDKTRRFGFFWAVICLLGTAALVLVLIRSITRPIDLLREGTREIAEGRFHHRVPVRTRDELGELVSSFNEMAQQLKKLDDMKSEFMAVVSHELKTPLTSMKGAVELLLEEVVGPINSKQRHLLDINSEGIQKLSGFIDEILNLTRMEGGMLDLNRTWFDLRELVESKLTSFELLADSKKIELAASYQPSPLPHVYGDADRIRQVLANLLSNAIRFAPAYGRVSVEVRYHGNPQGTATGRGVQVRVTDTGEGIPKEEWKRIFEKFYQIQDRFQRGSGSGLGLSIAKHIVEAHGGSICVESSSEEGTTFSFDLPQEVEMPEKAQQALPGKRLSRLFGPSGLPRAPVADVHEF